MQRFLDATRRRESACIERPVRHVRDAEFLTEFESGVESVRHVEDVLHCGDVDVLAIGMECVGAPYTWLYGALNTRVISKQIMSSRRLNGANAEQAYHMVETFRARQVYLYAMGMESWYCALCDHSCRF